MHFGLFGREILTAIQRVSCIDLHFELNDVLPGSMGRSTIFQCIRFGGCLILPFLCEKQGRKWRWFDGEKYGRKVCCWNGRGSTLCWERGVTLG